MSISARKRAETINFLCAPIKFTAQTENLQFRARNRCLAYILFRRLAGRISLALMQFQLAPCAETRQNSVKFQPWRRRWAQLTPLAPSRRVPLPFLILLWTRGSGTGPWSSSGGLADGWLHWGATSRASGAAGDAGQGRQPVA
jgi:hypothetical protein